MIALGTGTSTGIPMLGCFCVVCQSLDHRDKRLRTSIYLETSSGKRILVDTTPDLRTQFLSNQISDIDFVIMTHDHADHLHGIDDLRPLTFGPPAKVIPLYCNHPTKKQINDRFNFINKSITFCSGQEFREILHHLRICTHLGEIRIIFGQPLP